MARKAKVAEPPVIVSLSLPKPLLQAMYNAVKYGLRNDAFPAGDEPGARELLSYLGARFPDLIAQDKPNV